MLLGRSSMCNKSLSQEIEEMAKRSLKELEDLQVWSFLKTVICFLCFTSCCSSLLYSSSSLQTSRCGSCIFAPSLSLLPFSRQSPIYVALSSSLSSQFLTMRPLASPGTALRTINLHKCNVNGGSFNCIPKCDLHS